MGAIAVLLFASGCRTEADDDLAVKNGIAEIKAAKEFQELFPQAKCFVSHHHGVDTSNPCWNSKVGLFGRYVLTMQFDVSLDLGGRHAVQTGVPKYYFNEVQRIDGRAIKYGANQHEFGPLEWDKLRKAKGDFSAIGITVSKDQPITGFETVWPSA